jgi:sugar/nucleoside kinase (ribokinase family)
MKDAGAYDIICVGNYTKDTIISPKGVQFVDGGAVNYAAHAAASLGYAVAVVTHLSKEDARVVNKFSANGIACFPVYTPQSTLMKLEYPTTNPDFRCLTVAATTSAITPQEIEGLHARVAAVGTSLRGEVGLDVIQALHRQGMLVAADMQGFVRVLRDRELVYEPWDEMEITLPYVDILKSDAVEAEFLTGESDIHEAARRFAQLGAKEVLLTHKEGLLVFAENQFLEVGFYPRRLDGRSGRGDTCLGSYAACRLDKSPAEACIWAAAVTSLKMEDLGPFHRSIDEVESLIRERYRHRVAG